MQSEEIDKEIEAEKKHELIEEPKDRLSVGENEKETKKELINRDNLKEIPIIEKELNIEKKEKSFDPEDSSTSEDSESDYETVSSTNASIEENFAKMKKQKSKHDLIDRILKSRYSRINQIFDEPGRTIPLPRKSGIINVTFSERVFPTPARESSHAEEQEVRCIPSIVYFIEKKKQELERNRVFLRFMHNSL